jgi:hypothetical protein
LIVVNQIWTKRNYGATSQMGNIWGGNMKKIICAIAVLLAGCAQKAESIQPSYVSPVGYESYTCKQLGQESARVESALATASQQQNKARTGDVVGVLLIGLPTSSMSGEAIAPEVAKLKGEKSALQQVAITKNCIG